MKAALPTVYLIRHGATEWSHIGGRHTGITDLPLTAAGETTAHALKPWLAAVPFARVLTSPMRRARETCDRAGLGPHAVVCADLSEWNYGDYEGRTTSDIRATDPDWNIFRDGCPGGESPEQVSTRADRLIAGLLAVEGNIALFSHGHFGCALAVRWIGLAIIEGQHFALDAGAASILGPKPGHPHEQVIGLWNGGPSTQAPSHDR